MRVVICARTTDSPSQHPARADAPIDTGKVILTCVGVGMGDLGLWKQQPLQTCMRASHRHRSWILCLNPQLLLRHPPTTCTCTGIFLSFFHTELLYNAAGSVLPVRTYT
jgi:hypothetical protein